MPNDAYFDSQTLKLEARELMRTASVPPLRMAALLVAINLALSLVDAAAGRFTGVSLDAKSFSVSFVSVFIMLLDLVLSAGFTNYCLAVRRGAKMPYDSLFDAFPFAGKVILLSLIQAALMILGFLLFIVPGFVAAFTYAFALYHLCEDPSIGVPEAMRLSRLEMRGYKTRFFLLMLSFLPLLFLLSLPSVLGEQYLPALFPDTLGGELLLTLAYGVLTGVPSIFLMPYLTLTKIGFYRHATAVSEPPETTENKENRLE